MKLKLFQSIEVPVPNGSTLTRFFFQDQPQLRNAYIKGIQFYTPTVLTATPNTGSTPATLADMKKATLTLYSGDLQVVFNMPILNLNEMNDFTSPFTFNLPEIQDLTISWVKSYIQLSSAAATTNVAFSLGVYYELPRKANATFSNS
jgi:hypothetical protein